MSRTKTERTDTFTATDDSAKKYQVMEFTEYTEYHDGSTFTSPEVWSEGSKYFELPNGERLKRLSENEFISILREIKLVRIK